MRTLEWKTLDWTGKNVLVDFDEQTIGRLTFNNAWYSHAEYNSQQRKTGFKAIGFWSKKIEVIQNDDVVGYITLHVWGDQILKMKSGNVYHLTSNFFGRNIKWLSPSGQTLMQYTQPSMSSSRKGTIETFEELPAADKDILLSSGLFIKALVILKFFVIGVISGVLLYRIVIQ